MLDQRYQKRFGIVFTQANLFTADIPYRITWSTPPGKADIDNATLEAQLGRKVPSNCTLPICIFTSIRCRVNEEEWSIDPLPGSHVFTKPLPFCFDLNLFRWFLPLLRR